MIVLKARRQGGDLLALGADGPTLAVRCAGGLQLWRGPFAGAEPTVLPGREAGWLRFTADGRRLLLDGPTSGFLDLPSLAFTPFPPKARGDYRFLALAPDGGQIVAAHLPAAGPCRIEAWSAAEPGVPRWSVGLDRQCLRPEFLTSDRFAVLESFNRPERNYLWAIRSAVTGEGLDRSPPFPRFPDRTAVSPDGAWVAGAKERTITVWPVADLGRPVSWQNDTRKSFTDVAFHPSGRYLAAAGNDGTVKLYETGGWALARSFAWNAGKVLSVGFSPDGALAAAGTDTGKVVVWDVDL